MKRFFAVVHLFLLSLAVGLAQETEEFDQFWKSLTPEEKQSIYKLVGASENPYASRAFVSRDFVPYSWLLEYKGAPNRLDNAASFYYQIGDMEKCFELAESYSSPYIIPKGNATARIIAKGCAVACLNNNLDMGVSYDKKQTLTALCYANEVVRYMKNYLDEYKTEERPTTCSLLEYLDCLNLARVCCSFLMKTTSEKDAEKIANDEEKLLGIMHKKLFLQRDRWLDEHLLQLGIMSNELAYFDLKPKVGFRYGVNFADAFWKEATAYTQMSHHSPVEKQLADQVALGYVRKFTALMTKLGWENNIDNGSILNTQLRCREFELYVKGFRDRQDYLQVSWVNIADQLQAGEYAMEHFEGPASGYFFTNKFAHHERNYAWLFNNGMESPELIHRGYLEDMETRGFDYILQQYPDCSRLYVTSTPQMQLMDIAPVESYVCRLHSLCDIAKVQQRHAPDMRRPIYVGDLAYGSRQDSLSDEFKGIANKAELGRFRDEGVLAEQLQEQYPSIKVLNGICALPGVVQLFAIGATLLHFSTHGMFDEEELRRLNVQDTLGAMTGENILRSCRLAISNYNVDHNQYSLSAADIVGLDLSRLDLVFLDACETAAGKVMAGDVLSLAEAFRRAGAHVVIANLDPIPSDLATQFALDFYAALERVENLHDAFYAAKWMIGMRELNVFTLEEMEPRADELKEIISRTRIVLWE